MKGKFLVLSFLVLASVLLGMLFYSSFARGQSTVTGYVTIPAQFMQPRDGSWTGNVIYHVGVYHYELVALIFEGGVLLPHGATVTNTTFYWVDDGDEDIDFTLHRRYSSIGGPHGVMAMANSSGTPYEGYSYDDTIDDATIDNSQNSYYLEMSLPPSSGIASYYFFFAVIEYTLPAIGGVGGFAIPIDKLELLAPYFALAVAVVLAVGFSTFAWSRWHRKPTIQKT